MSKPQSSRPLRRPEYWLILGSLAFVAVCFYGIRAAAVLGLAGVTAMVTDFICLFLRGRSYRLIDLSNVGNALVLALMFPATVPYSIVLLSTMFGTVVGAHVFGYRRDLLFPPSAVGYLFAVTCWRNEVLQFPQIGQRLVLFGNDVAMTDSLTAQFNEKGSIHYLHTELIECLIGAVPGPMGTSCIIMLTLGLVILLVRRQIDICSVLGYLLCVILPIVSGKGDAGVLMTNMLLFSAIFFVGDSALMPCRGLMAYLAAAMTGVLTGFLIVEYHLEYAPLIAVILSCPFWRWIAALEARLRQKMAAEKEAEKEALPDESAERV